MGPINSEISTILKDELLCSENTIKNFFTTLELFKLLEENFYYHRSYLEEKLPCPFHTTRFRRAFIHLKKTLSSTTSSVGNFKTITHSLCYQTAEFVIKATSKLFNQDDKLTADKELEIHKKLNGFEGIVPLYDWIYHTSKNGTKKLTLITKSYNLGNLYCFNTKSLTTSQKINIIKNLLKALLALHNLNEIHNDIKPENIVLHRQSEENIIAALIDFGLTTKVGEENKAFGTKEFQPPEFYDPKMDALTQTKDIWAMGCVIYQLAWDVEPPWLETPSYLFSSDTPIEQPITENNLKYLAWLMLAKDPVERPTAKQCLQWIENHENIT